MCSFSIFIYLHTTYLPSKGEYDPHLRSTPSCCTTRTCTCSARLERDREGGGEGGGAKKKSMRQLFTEWFSLVRINSPVMKLKGLFFVTLEAVKRPLCTEKCKIVLTAVKPVGEGQL